MKNLLKNVSKQLARVGKIRSKKDCRKGYDFSENFTFGMTDQKRERENAEID